ncbi:MAG: sodium/solute symporter [Planctomycetaceae bacterium]|nr:sodium/solute symporter [Planctomycetaceae bacterium]
MNDLVLLAADESRTAIESSGLTPIDIGIIVLYALGTIALGWYYGRKQETTSEYFTGSGNMNPILIGISLFATLLSTITYLSLPGEVIGKGPGYLANYLGLPIVYLVVAYVLLPVYMKQKVTSAYELLEVKLGVEIRLLGATMFLILRLFWMSLLLYLTGKALATMLGLDDNYIPAVVAVTGVVAITYTSLGGLRAVVITDLMQTVLLFGGAWLVIGTITWQMGGFGWFPTEWDPNWDTQPLISFDPSTRITFLGSFLSMSLWYIATSGGDQVSVQRFMSTTDARAARKSFLIQLCVSVTVGVTLALVGFSLLGYFQTFPGALPADMHLKTTADDIFPHMIAHHLPVGISGLVVSAMFAAAMSSIDSGVNSITAVILTDYLDRFDRAPKSERAHVLFARGLAVTIGVIVVTCSGFMGLIEGNITTVTGKTTNLLTVPIFCLFVFALFIPFATRLGVWVGTICGTSAAILVAFSKEISVSLELIKDTDVAPVSFQWIPVTAFVVTLTIGCTVSYLQTKLFDDDSYHQPS